MCIICIKDKGLDMPQESILKTMFKNNPHGSGYCYSDGEQVIIKKGYMTFDSFMKALKEIPNPKDKNVVLHFRVTTHGSTSPQNCHPFPLSNKIEDLKATEIMAKVGIIHNGIIFIQEDKKNDLSDTQTYIKDVLYDRYKIDNNFMDSVEQREEIKREITSKMVVMRSDGSYETIGDFNTDNDGYIYSNYSYIPYEEKTSYYENSYFSDMYEDDDILLDFSDFVIIDGVRVYGDEIDLFITTTNEIVCYDGECIKVSNCAFNERGELITYQDVLDREALF